MLVTFGRYIDVKAVCPFLRWEDLRLRKVRCSLYSKVV
jgi:hypothetical protein